MKENKLVPVLFSVFLVLNIANTSINLYQALKTAKKPCTCSGDKEEDES